MKNHDPKRTGAILGGILVTLLAFPTGQRADSEFRVNVVTDRAGAMLGVGDSATFHIMTLAHPGTVAYLFSLDGAVELGRGIVELAPFGHAGGRASVAATLDRPGILRCTVTFDNKEQNRRLVGTGMAAAAFEPLNILPTATLPDDFETFWREQIAALADVPLDLRLEPVDAGSETVEAFKITLNNVDGARVHGYLLKPKGNGPFPAILRLPAAGVYEVSPSVEAGFAAAGFLAMSIGAHDVENGLPAGAYSELAKGDLFDYPLRGRDNKENYYFRRVFLSCIRAADYLASRQDWDKKHLIVHGSSQGGALALVTASLDQRVTAVAAYAPAMCEHSGLAFGRPSGWPRLVPRDDDGKPDRKILDVSAYYDAVNFARQIKVPALFGVGLVDTTCPPTTVFAAYNVLAGPKQIEISPQAEHEKNKRYAAVKNRWIWQQAGMAQ